MKERERGKGQGKSRRRVGCCRQGSIGGYWGGFRGGIALKRTVGSMMVL